MSLLQGGVAAQQHLAYAGWGYMSFQIWLTQVYHYRQDPMFKCFPHRSEFVCFWCCFCKSEWRNRFLFPGVYESEGHLNPPLVCWHWRCFCCVNNTRGFTPDNKIKQKYLALIPLLTELLYKPEDMWHGHSGCRQSKWNWDLVLQLPSFLGWFCFTVVPLWVLEGSIWVWTAFLDNTADEPSSVTP